MGSIDKTVLIVEDDSLTLKMLADSFKNEGFSVIEAIDGKEGLEFALEKCPDIILLDIVIPEIDGLTVFKKLREEGCCKETTIILLTNLEETDDIIKAFELGRCDFMVKTNWAVKDIIKRVKMHLGVED